MSELVDSLVVLVPDNTVLTDLQQLVLGSTTELADSDIIFSNEETIHDSKRSVAIQANVGEVTKSGRLSQWTKKFLDDAVDDEKDKDYKPGKNSKSRKRRSGRSKKNSLTQRLDGKKNNDSTPSFVCKICSREFRQKGNLKTHLRVHSEDKPFSCRTCSKSFKSKEALLRHEYTHTGEKPFSCEDCQRGFSSALALKEHQAGHNNQVLYECQVCHRGFRHVSAVKRHLTIHSDSTPFACDICGRRFTQKTYLRSHQRSHTGERPYSCDDCGKKFAHLSDVTRHKIIHTGKKPFVCKHCGAAFSDASSQRRHERDHNDARGFPCEGCGLGFKKQRQLKTHKTKCKMLANQSRNESIQSVQKGDEVIESESSSAAVLVQRIEELLPENQLLGVDDDGTKNNELNSSTESLKLCDVRDLTYEVSDFDSAVIEDSDVGSTVVVELTSLDITQGNQLENLMDGGEFDAEPDFTNQDYFNWLSKFTSYVKLLQIPVEGSLFTRISQVHKNLMEGLAAPSGVLVNKENFRIVMAISQDLLGIINAHLCYILSSLDDTL